ncbi:MAG: tetratricopeptide repeat protein [Candidatus Cloacimonetes bacterium]|nr:tetratricopeptide repeat protein [Candidatus Cloacimonadota bacterium]
MKSKKNKFAFGIFQDGLTVKIAELVSIDGTVKILRLGKTELSAPLYPKVTDGMQEEFTAIAETRKEQPEDFDEFKGIEELEDLDIPGTLTDAELNLGESSDIEVPDSIPEFNQDEVPSGLNDLQVLLQTFPLEKGRIAVNANDEQVSYYQFDSAFATAKIEQKLKSELLSKEEIKAKNYALDYIINPNETGLAFVHRGRFELLDAIQDINTIISREKFIYNHIDTNEISLINLIRNCYDFPPEDYVTVLYIGIDYIVGIVMKDKSHIKTFPIIITEIDPEKKRMAIYSKIILEQDISNTPITQHVIIAGEDVSDDDIEFFQKKGFYWDPPKRLEIQDIEMVEAESDKTANEKIAQYAIPISLAWKVLETRNKNFLPSNLLPTKIIESQKYFKIAWHGFLVLAAIFYFALSGTVRYLELKQDILNTQQEITQIQTDLRNTRRMISQVQEVKQKMQVIQDNIDKVETLTGFKNQWHYILKNFSITMNNNKLTWIESMVSYPDNFLVTGYTTRRHNIIELANLFPNCQIKRINSIFIEEVPIWIFDLNFSYPDPQEVEKEKTISKINDLPQIYDQKEIVNPEMDISSDEIILVYNNIITTYFSGNISDAFEKFSQFIIDYPDHPRAYNARYFIGECLFRLDRVEEAVNTFKQIIEVDGSKTPDALMMLGNAYEELDNIDSAIYYWDQLIRRFPQNNLTKLARYKTENYRG